MISILAAEHGGIIDLEAEFVGDFQWVFQVVFRELDLVRGSRRGTLAFGKYSWPFVLGKETPRFEFCHQGAGGREDARTCTHAYTLSKHPADGTRSYLVALSSAHLRGSPYSAGSLPCSQ